MFTFEPMSEEEIKAMNLMDEGEYQFEVLKASHGISHAGNPKIDLQLKVWDKSGSQRLIFDCLVNTKGMAYKVRHFCISVGLHDEYISGKIEADKCVGRFGVAKIVIQKNQPRPEGGVYPDKNTVSDYIIKDDIKVTKMDTSGFDDQIPF